MQQLQVLVIVIVVGVESVRRLHFVQLLNEALFVVSVQTAAEEKQRKYDKRTDRVDPQVHHEV